MTTTTTTYQIRNYRDEGDIPGIVAVFNASLAAQGDDPTTTEEGIRSFMEAPGVDSANDTFIVERDGQIIGYADSELNQDTGSAWSECAVHPDYANQGIGAELIHRTDAYVLQRAQEVLPPDMPISMNRNVSERNTGARRLFEAEGYQHIRSGYRMRLELDQPIDVPPLPEGITLRPFDVERDGYPLYEMQQEIWQDHRGFEASTWEEWSHYLLDPAKDDFSLWLIAYEGDQMVGMCVCRPYGDAADEMNWVRILGVRRPWRKHGLGMALLKRAFVLYRDNGYKRVGLGVDAASLTNAVALYERAGMHVWFTSLGYRKMLRGEAPEEV